MLSDKIKTVELVKGILERYPKARDNDNTLYQYVMNNYGVSVKTPFKEVCDMISSRKLPSMWTIERARRKVQELYPELAPSSEAKAKKDMEEDEYKKLSRIEV